MRKSSENKGSAVILITFLVTAAVLGIALGISWLSLGEIKISHISPETFVAYYAAEAGAERGLYEDRQAGGTLVDSINDNLGEGVTYVVNFSGVSPLRVINSVGSFRGVDRAVETTY